jgi:hypothetical protein
MHGQVEKKQTRTLEELQAEREEEEERGEVKEEEFEEDEDEEHIYNPLNLPLGWDGASALLRCIAV